MGHLNSTVLISSPIIFCIAARQLCQPLSYREFACWSDHYDFNYFSDICHILSWKVRTIHHSFPTEISGDKVRVGNNQSGIALIQSFRVLKLFGDILYMHNEADNENSHGNDSFPGDGFMRWLLYILFSHSVNRESSMPRMISGWVSVYPPVL